MPVGSPYPLGAFDGERRYTELYQKYQGLFESKLESFLTSKGHTSEAFMKSCQEVSQARALPSIHRRISRSKRFR